MSLAQQQIGGAPRRKAFGWVSALPAVWLIVGLALSLAAVALLIPFDWMVTSRAGHIVALEKVRLVQPLDPSIVKTLDVAEGQSVAAGQLLATLDSGFTQPDLDQTRAQVAAYAAEVARGEAEMQHRPFDPAPQKGRAGTALQLQKMLFDKRAADYAATLLSFDEKIKQQQTTVAKLEADVARYVERLKIATQIEGMRDTLLQSGSGSLLNLLTAQDSQIEMRRTMEFEANGVAEARHLAASLKADRDSFIQKWMGDTAQALVTARNNLDTARALLDKAARHQDLVSIRATEPGVVLQLAKASVGSVLLPGTTLMAVMPLGSAIAAEISLSPRDIGFVKIGNPVRLQVDAFKASEYGYAEGHVTWISPDALYVDDNGQPVAPFYRVRVSVDALHFTAVPADFRLIPGMTLSANVNVGPRVLGRLLFENARRSAGEALREP